MINDLQDLMQVYKPFWPEWIKNHSCTLNEDDLYIIDVHSKNNFEINLFDSFMFYNQKKHIDRINAKLRWDNRKFKQWVILNFLFSIIELARNNGGQHYLHRPIGTLELNEALKKILFKLDLLYLNQIFEKYKEEDFEKEKIFNVIVEFEIANRCKEQLIAKK
ncbi:MAG: hypothetical protein Q8L81_16640 [Bacteroidota bacterium]|nr:hypothetical protein [Bacteroidota bacterium]